MPRGMITVYIEDKEIKSLINSKRFLASFNKKLSQQLIGFGAWAGARVKKQMREGTYPSLGIQGLIKGSSQTLIQTGTLLRSISFKYFKSGKHLAGVTIGARGSTNTGLSLNKLSQILNEGTSFAPSLAQRIALAHKAQKAGVDQNPFLGKKEIWNIPPRPFLSDALNDKEVYEKFAQKSVKAIQDTLSSLKGK